MSDVHRDQRGRIICQKCGTKVARLWTFHRRTETDHLISYAEGQAVFTKLPRDGGVAAWCRDEYLCYGCCYSDLEPGEMDEAADLEAGQTITPCAIEERAELEAEESLGAEDGLAQQEEEAIPDEQLILSDGTEDFDDPDDAGPDNEPVNIDFDWRPPEPVAGPKVTWGGNYVPRLTAMRGR